MVMATSAFNCLASSWKNQYNLQFKINKPGLQPAGQKKQQKRKGVVFLHNSFTAIKKSSDIIPLQGLKITKQKKKGCFKEEKKN